MLRLTQKYRKLKDFIAKFYGFLAALFEGKTPKDYLPETAVRRRKRLSRFVFHFAFAALVAALLTIPGPNIEPLPLLTAGDVANTDLISPVTAEVEPDVRSKIRREELAKRVAPIFDYDDTILNVWLSNWEQTFKTVRKEFYERGFPGRRDAVPLDSLAQRITDLTGQTLPARDLLYLHQNKFSVALEQAFVKVAKRLTGHLISPTDLFPNYYSTGIVVREVNRSLHETLIHDVSRIWSIEHAREYLNHVPTVSARGEREPVQRIVEIVNNVVVPNVKFNAALTQKRISSALGTVQAAMVTVRAGQVIIQRGERINEDKAELLKRLSELTSAPYQWRRFFLHLAIWLTFFSVIFRLWISRRTGMWHLSLKDNIFFMTLTLLSILFVKYPLPFVKSLLEVKALNLKYGIEYIMPVSTGGIIIHLMMGREAGYCFALIFSALLGFLLDGNFFFGMWTMGVTISAIRSIRSCKQRTDLYRCGLWSGSVGAILVAAHALSQSLGHQYLDWTALGISVGLAFLSGLVSAVLTSALIPPLEALFGYTTSLKLLELSNFNHPLLHSLMMKAPGTYHHSVIVGSLAEIAADAIRANGLLARVSAYYHDIGKMNKPLYFIENQAPNDNPHDHLAPTMSAKILFSHVKNGVRMAREHNLGNKITDIIEQHHGTTLIAYFYNKAKKSEKAELDPVSEADFRYPGPRPQTREAAIVMLADACEAATRSISDPTPSKIETMVHSIINRRFLEEQFNECDLTFSDLRVIEKCFTRTLVSLYHHRIEYPGQKSGGTSPAVGSPVTPLNIKKSG